MAALDTLPAELLSLVANHLDRPKDIVNIALSSRRLNEFVKLEGWRAFLRGRFGVADLDSDAKTAVHGITTLHRNWARKAFIARYLEPSKTVTSLASWETKTWRVSSGQTRGYSPCLDSYEELHGGWVDRKEVLAWSAGTQVVLRVKESGMKSTTTLLENQHSGEASEAVSHIDQFEHSNSWYTYTPPKNNDGVDDIVGLNLLRPHQKDQAFEHVVFATASGQLSVLNVDYERRETTVQAYETGSRPRCIASLSVSRSSSPLIAANIEGASLALYPFKNPHSPSNAADTSIGPMSEVSPIISGSSVSPGRIWSCNFISNDTIAVGLGPSQEPLEVYGVTQTGFSSQPLRKFNLDPSAGSAQRNTSVYPVVPVPHETEAASATNHLFLSGGFDGIVRLHDMRSPRNFETIFWDVTNDSSIYSLACQGFQRFVVGSSMLCMIKVFDLRFSGSHVYHSIPVTGMPQAKQKDYIYNPAANRASTQAISRTGGWNVYLNPRGSLGNFGNRRPVLSIDDYSPVYSLSIPSAISPNVYAGLEGRVQNLTMLSVLDQHPDPLLANYVTRIQKHDRTSSSNPFENISNLGMYEQGSEEELNMQLLVQDDVSMASSAIEKRKDFSRLRGLDERWKDPGEDGERWVRGQEPQGRREEHSGRARRRQGRGRRRH